MRLGDLYDAALAADPLACYATMAALALVAWNIVLRKGGADAGSIIRVFAGCATVATMFKIAWWVVAMIFATVPHPPAAPSGTDGVLVLGAIVSVLYSQVEDLRKTVVDDDESEESSLAEAVVGRITHMPAMQWLLEMRRKLPLIGQAAIETSEAVTERETLEKEREAPGPGSAKPR